MKSNLKKYLGYVVILITLVAFGLYIKLNPSVIDQLRSTKLITVFVVLFLYSLMTAVLVWVYKVILLLSDMHIANRENVLLTMYTSVVNFFGPLQSGPGFRMVYLKKKHDINIKKYFSANVVYYLFFALVSGVFILSGIVNGWLALLIGVIAAVVVISSPKLFTGIPIVGNNKYIQGLDSLAAKFRKDLYLLLGLTTLQLLTITTVYYVELRSIDSSVNYLQAVIYAGAANFSLFVSLTPGALGFRESFLFFTQRLHQINSDTIIAASILDRALFVLFLALMMLVILAMHGKKLLRLDRSKDS